MMGQHQFALPVSAARTRIETAHAHCGGQRNFFQHCSRSLLALTKPLTSQLAPLVLFRAASTGTDQQLAESADRGQCSLGQRPLGAGQRDIGRIGGDQLDLSEKQSGTMGVVEREPDHYSVIRRQVHDMKGITGSRNLGIPTAAALLVTPSCSAE